MKKNNSETNDEIIRNRKKSNSVNIFKVNGKFSFVELLKNILLTLGGSALIGFLTKNSVTLYSKIEKPFFSPPAITFSIVWPILYIMMAIAAYRISMKLKGKSNKNEIFLYLIQLSINFLWSIVFFNLRLYGISFILAVILLILIVITTVKFFKVDKIAGALMVPYLLWVSYASVLSFFIWKLNEM